MAKQSSFRNALSVKDYAAVCARVYRFDQYPTGTGRHGWERNVKMMFGSGVRHPIAINLDTANPDRQKTHKPLVTA